LDRDKLIDLWKDAYQKMALAARGRLAHKKLAEIKAKTKREEKAKNLRNKNLQVMNPTGKRQIAGGNTSADDEAEIASILSASGK